MKYKAIIARIGLLFLAGSMLAACRPPQVEGGQTAMVTEVSTEAATEAATELVATTAAPETGQPEQTAEPLLLEGPVTLNLSQSGDLPTLDPALATDTASVDLAANLFVGLTRIDPATGEVLPYLATSWEAGVADDGDQTWTFNLRDDIAWVRYDPETGETAQEMDETGAPRFVTAFDVAYGVRRSLNPETASDFAFMLAAIENAAAILQGSETLTLDDLGVAALDAATVQFTLETPAGYFPAVASLWVSFPQPRWLIEDGAAGERWTEPGALVTNGPFVVDSWASGEIVLVKNPLYFEADGVQIERVEMAITADVASAFSLYEDSGLDTVDVPLADVDRVQADPVLSAEYVNAPVACTYYYGFNNQKAPFDDVRVRMAFSEAIDRQSLIDNVLRGGQQAASSFAAPGTFGAPEPGSVGVFHDPGDARAQLQSFLDENDLTVDQFNSEYQVTLLHNTSEGHAEIAEAIRQMWRDTLGVEVTVVDEEWGVYIETLRKESPIEAAPHIFNQAWCGDYADEHYWVHRNFNIQAGANNLRRNCQDPNCSASAPSAFDDLTLQAQASPNPDERAALYTEAEVILARDEAAYAPLYHFVSVKVARPWLARTYGAYGGSPWYRWTVDWDAKRAAIAEKQVP